MLAAGVKYTLGSSWAAVPVEEQTFSAVVSVQQQRTAEETSSGAWLGAATAAHQVGRSPGNGARGGAGRGEGVLASAAFTPPSAPEVFTTFLMGSKAFGYSLLPQVDAPETGPCKPP